MLLQHLAKDGRWKANKKLLGRRKKWIKVLPEEPLAMQDEPGPEGTPQRWWRGHTLGPRSSDEAGNRQSQIWQAWGERI